MKKIILVLLSLLSFQSVYAEEVTQSRAETLYTQLRTIATTKSDLYNQYIFTQEAIKQWVTGIQPVMTLPVEGHTFAQLNLGFDVSEIEEFARRIGGDRLSELPSGVLVPVLSLISLNQLESLKKDYFLNLESDWGKSVMAAIAIKSVLINRYERQRRNQQNSRLTLIEYGSLTMGAIFAYFVGTNTDEWIDLFGGNLQAAGLVAGGTMIGTMLIVLKHQLTAMKNTYNENNLQSSARKLRAEMQNNSPFAAIWPKACQNLFWVHKIGGGEHNL